MKARYINLFPLVCFFALFAYACYAALVVGHWPYYAFPDPKDLPAGHLTTWLALLALVGFASVVFIPIGYAVFRASARWKSWQLPDQGGALTWYGIAAAPWLLDLVIAYFSRYSLLSWIFD